MNAQEYYKQAIDKGILSANSKDSNYAGNFMFMGIQDNKVMFKHYNTRKYGHDKQSILEATKF